jgi:SAM-dependent methyltransferase
VIELRRILRPLYEGDYTRSALKALIPPRFHLRMREWFQLAGNEVQWCRVVMNREIEGFIRSLDCSAIDALEISGSGSQGRYGFRSYRSVQYPKYDVCTGPLAGEEFDLVIAEQVFEHILQPDRAATNVFQMLRPGGFFVISTPFLLKVHEVPLDLYRWTERGMRQLLETAGFTDVSTASWGNRECLIADMTPGLVWTAYNPRKHSLHNEPEFAIVVWAFAKKGKLE